MTDEQLSQGGGDDPRFRAAFAQHKQRVVEALRRNGHVVGFMGDGINDAPALRAADVGISVDTAVDIAKESADMILLEKSLMVLEEGVLEGRKVFVNILKYIRMGASSNFGNMFSVLGASAFLPFLPMMPIQILTNNLLYDFSQVPIPTDNVGPEPDRQAASVGHRRNHALHFVHRPDQFDFRLHDLCRDVVCLQMPRSGLGGAAGIGRAIRPCRRGSHLRAALFQTGWFVESLMTQTLIIHVIRTRKIPFIQARASRPLTITTVVIMAVAAWLPYSPLAAMLGLVPLPWLFWPILLDAALLRGS